MFLYNGDFDGFENCTVHDEGIGEQASSSKLVSILVSECMRE